MQANTHADRNPSGRYAQKREQILDAACRKFNVLGVRGATLEDIASDVGMNLTSIRHYFRRKDDLVAAGFLRSIDTHAGLLEEALKAGEREAQLRRLVKLHFDLRRASREGTAPEVMIFGDLRSLEEGHAAEVWPRYVGLFKRVRQIVSPPDLIAGNRASANARTHYMMSQLFRTAYWLPAYPLDSFDWVEAKFIDILLNGLGAPGRQPPEIAIPEAVEAEAGGSSWEGFLLAATRLINEQGYRGASVDAIARMLNRTKGSFYHHVEGKGDLLTACFNRSLGVLKDAQRNAITQHRHGMDQAHAATLALVASQQLPTGPLLRSSALMSAEADKRDSMLGELAQVVTRFSGMITDGIIDGSVRPCDPRVAGEMIMVTVNSAGQLKNWAGDVTPDQAVDLYVKPLFAGLFA